MALFGVALFLLNGGTKQPTALAAAGINHEINFQGKLVNPNGTNVTDGTYSIVFSIYNVSSGGTALWSETQSVAISNGIFQVNLGSVTPLPGSVDFNSDSIYLGIKVGADAEMTPRIQFTAVPQAFNAEKLGGLDKSGFIQNGTSSQTANFNISGTGQIGTSLTVPLLQSASGAALNITGNAASVWGTSANNNLTIQAGGTGTLALDTGGAGTVNIGTANATAVRLGRTAATVTVTGNSASTFVLNGVTVDATEFNRLDGHDAALVDTNDVVSTAIIGTGALNTGSITSGFGSINVGSDPISTTGLLTGGTLNVVSDATIGGALTVSGSSSFGGNIDMNNNTIANVGRKPKVVLFGANSSLASNASTYNWLVSSGHADGTVDFTSTAAQLAADDYDAYVCDYRNWSASPCEATAYTLWKTYGKNVITIGNDTTTTLYPIAGVASHPSSAYSSTVTGTNIIVRGMTATDLGNGTDSGMDITSLAPNFTPLYTLTADSTRIEGAVGESEAGGIWFHDQTSFLSNNGDGQQLLLNTLSYETGSDLSMLSARIANAGYRNIQSALAVDDTTNNVNLVSGNLQVGGVTVLTSGRALQGITNLSVIGDASIGGSIKTTAVNATGYTTTNTGSTYSGQYTRLGYCTLTTQYQDCRSQATMVSTGDVGTMDRAIIDIRVKQQNAMAGAPYVMVQLIDDNTLPAAAFMAIPVHVQSDSTTVELWFRDNTANQVYRISPLVNSGSVQFTWQANQGFQTALPSPDTGMSNTAATYASQNIASLSVNDVSTISTAGILQNAALSGTYSNLLTFNNSGNSYAGTWNGNTISIANGGTGATTLGSAGSLAYSNGSSYTFTGVGTAGQCLLSGGASTPTWGSCAPASGSANYIQNTTSAQNANFNITGNGTIGGSLTAGSLNVGSSKFTVASTGLTSIVTSTGGPILYVKELGTGYGNPNAAIVADTDNTAGTEHLFQGRSGGTNVFDVASNGAVTANGTVSFQGSLYGNGKDVIDTGDGWLRVNPSNGFTNGIYLGTGAVRTDGTLQVGSSGSVLSLNAAGALTLNGTNIDISSNGAVTSLSTLQGTQLKSTVATGTAPLTVNSTTVVTNLNADLLDGQSGSYYQNAANINTGTLSDSRLSSNVALLNNAQTFTGVKTFSAATNFTASGTGLTVINSATIGGDLTVSGSIQGSALDAGFIESTANNQGTSNVTAWYKVGTIVGTPGARFKLDLLGANGYSAGAQGAEGETIVTGTITNNGNTTIANVVGSWYSLDGTPAILDVKFVENGSRTTYDVYMQFASFSSHTILPTLRGASWTPAWAAESDPGANSATVQEAVNQFSVTSGNVNVSDDLNVSGSTRVASLLVNSNLTVQGTATIGSVLQMTASGNTKAAINAYGGDGNGIALAIGGGAATIVGAGESAGVASANVAYNLESLYLTSDGAINLMTNLQNGWSSGVTALSLATNGAATFSGTIVAGSTIQGTQLKSTVATGTAPLTVNSTTVVTNFNADLLDGYDSSYFAPASGSANYIQNTTSAQSANFNITGSGTIGSSLQIGAALGPAAGNTLTVNAGTLGSTVGNELVVASFGAKTNNADSLTVSAYRATAGTDWTTANLVLGRNVDSTTRAGAYITFGNGSKYLGVNTLTPTYGLDVAGTFHVSGAATFGSTITANRFSVNSSGYVTINDAGAAKGDRLLQVGDDSYFTDVDAGNTLGLYGTTDNTQGKLQLGSGGPILAGSSSGLNINTNTAIGGNLAVGAASTDGARLYVVGAGSANGTAWTAHDAMGYPLRSITYGNGLFVAVSSYGIIVTSPDGVTWTTQSSPSSPWQAVTYGNGLFVAISDSTVAATSPDGITWTSRTIPSAPWKSITYGNGLFAAVGTGTGATTIMTSPDGITWTARADPWVGLAHDWNSITYGNGEFLAVGDVLGDLMASMTSTDGVTWTTALPGGGATGTWASVAYGSGRFVAVNNYSSGTRIEYSADGVNWNSSTYYGSEPRMSVIYANGTFIVLGSDSSNYQATALMSPNGVNFVPPEVVVPGLSGGTSIAYGSGMFVAVDDLIGGVATSSASGAALSVNGDTVLSGSVTLGGILQASGTTQLCLNGAKVSTCSTTATGASFIQGGNSFGANAYLGTNDNYSLNFQTNNTTRLTIDTSGNATFNGGLTVSGATNLNNTLAVNGNYIYASGSRSIIQTTDSYLRLNQNGSFTNGVYTPGTLRVDGGLFLNGVLSGTTYSLNTTGGVCVKYSSCTYALGVSGSIAATGTIVAGHAPDLAETIDAAPGVEAADVVMADPNNTERVVKATGAYTGAAVGVISDGSSSFIVDSHADSDSIGSNGLNGAPLVLAGRVPVKVTNEGGAIQPGDYLTTSSTPGMAMKATHAGPSIGKALGFFNGDTGTVLALINISYYNPDTDGNLQGANLSLTGDASITGGLTLTGTANIAADLNVSGQTTVHNLTATGSVSISNDLTVSGDVAVQGSLTVTGPATVGTITVNGHIITGGVAPTNTVSTVFASGAVTATINGNDTTGTITITTSSTSSSLPSLYTNPNYPQTADLSNGLPLLTVIFNQQFGAAPRVLLSPDNASAGSLDVFTDGESTTGFTLSANQLPQPGKTYKFTYWVTQ